MFKAKITATFEFPNFILEVKILSILCFTQKHLLNMK